MAGGGSGRALAVLALVVSLIALGISFLAYRQVGGARQLKDQVQALENALDIVRKEMADTLARIERVVRPADSGERAPRGTRR